MFRPGSSLIQIVQDHGPKTSMEGVFLSPFSRMPAKGENDLSSYHQEGRAAQQPSTALDFYIQNLMVSVNELSDEIPIHNDNCKVNHHSPSTRKQRRRSRGRCVRRCKSADETESFVAFAESADDRPKNYARQYSDSELCRSRWSSVSPTRGGGTTARTKIDQAPCLRRRVPENEEEHQASTS